MDPKKAPNWRDIMRQHVKPVTTVHPLEAFYKRHFNQIVEIRTRSGEIGYKRSSSTVFMMHGNSTQH